MLSDIRAFQGEEHREFTLKGGRPGAVLVHGFPGTPAEMRPMAELLHSAGWTTHVPLLPGFGAEINTIADCTYDEWLAKFVNAVSAMRVNHDPLLLVGNSMGGALAVAAAARTQVDGLVLLAPFYKLDHILWQMLPVLRLIIPNVRIFRLTGIDFNDAETRKGIHTFMPDADLDDPVTQEAIRDFAVPVAMINQIRIAGQKAYQNAKKVSVPTLVIQGKRDELVSAANTELLVQQLNGTSTYISVDGEHDLIFDNRPAWPRIRQIVLEFADSFVRVPSSQETR
jgi:carboxylesterase